MDSTVIVCTYRPGIDGKLINGTRFFPDDLLPADIDAELLKKLRGARWVEDRPTAPQPLSDATQAARAARLEEQRRMAAEAEERRQRLLDERQSDPQRLADQCVKLAEEARRAADSELRAAVADRNQLVRERIEPPIPIDV